MSSILKHIPPYEELKLELENPKNLEKYSKYDSFIGDEKAINLLMDKFLEEDNKQKGSIFKNIFNSLVQKY